MARHVPAAAANRRFSEILRHVREGRTYVITSHGRPVARLVPVDDRSTRSNAAQASLLARLRAEPAVTLSPWTREELHDAD